MLGQVVGGILGGLLGIILTESAADDDSASAWVRPIDDITYIREDANGNKLIEAKASEASPLNFAALVSEGVGTGIIVLMTMMILTKTQEFTKDKNIVCFTRASIIIGARLMAGGIMVTGLPIGKETVDLGVLNQERDRKEFEHYKFKAVGPLCNPAIALGL